MKIYSEEPVRGDKTFQESFENVIKQYLSKHDH